MSTASEMQDKVETRPGQTTQVESASDTEMADAVESGETQEPPTDNNSQALAHTTAKDRTLQEFLGMMDQYAPIVFKLRIQLDHPLTCKDSRCSDRLLPWVSWI